MPRRRPSPQPPSATIESPPPAEPLDVVFTDAERLALTPPGDLLPDAWADSKRVLPSKNPLGQRWLNDNAPPLRVVMQLAVDDAIAELYLQKAAQIGGSECFRNVLGCDAEQSGLSWLIVLPDEKVGKRQFKDEYWPLYRDTPSLAVLRTGRKTDFTRYGVRLRNGHECDIGWSGSPSSLAASPKARVLLDEVDKYDETQTREAPPADLARVRLRKFGARGKLFAVTTPTHGEGQMAKLMAGADILLRYHVPCPHCGTHQALHQDRLKWDKFGDVEPRRRAALIEHHDAAWFECEALGCGGRITDSHKRDIVARGYFADADRQWKLFPDGRREGTKPPGRRVGMHLPAFYDFQTPWPQIAAAIVLAGHDPRKLQDVYNSTFGEPFTVRVQSASQGDFDRRCVANPDLDFVPAKAGVVPAWASRLVLIADTQKDHFYYVLRAYGYMRRSQRVAHGIVRTFDELAVLENRPWAYEGNVYPPITVFRTGIDSGGTTSFDDAAPADQPNQSRTREVYDWCRQNPAKRYPLKGSSTPLESGVRYSDIQAVPPGVARDPYTVRLWRFDPETYGDLLMSSLDAQCASGLLDAAGLPVLADQWSLNDANDEVYNRQMGNVHKTVWKKRLKWMPKSIGARHDYWDCEKMQMAVAIGMNVCELLPTPTEMAGQHATLGQTAAVVTHQGIRRPDGRGWFAKR